MSEQTLTLHARGDLTVEQTHDHDDMQVTETRTVSVHATITVDKYWLQTEGSVHREGAVIPTRDVVDLVAEARSSEDVQYYATTDQREDWTLQLGGHIEDWLEVAIGAAKDQRVGASDHNVARTACYILASLAAFAENRPSLAMLDILDQYDLDDFDRTEILAELDEDEPTTAGEEVPADA